MRWLHWLKADERDQVRTRIFDVAVREMSHRHWGTEAPGRSPGDIPRMYILDIRGLFLAAGVLRYTLGKYDTAVLYRGQRKDWETQVSLYRGAVTRRDARERSQWLDDALDTIKDDFDPRGTTEEREALAQHYGLRTRWLDVVDNIQTAAWFAYYESNVRSPSDEGQFDDAVGYISAIACPLNDVFYGRAFDLRNKPSTWLRPHIQQAWAIRAGNPVSNLGFLSHLQVATFIIPRTLLKIWAGYNALTYEVMFPRENEDKGLYYWRRAEQRLLSIGLYPYPW